MKFSNKFLLSFFFVFSSFTFLLLLFGKKPSIAQSTSEGFIVNSFSGKCIDVAGGPGRSNGDRLQLWDCEISGTNPDNGSTTDQRWVLTSDGFIRNTLSGKCIDVAGAPGRSNGAALQLWDCERSGRNADNGSTTDQLWQLD